MKNFFTLILLVNSIELFAAYSPKIDCTGTIKEKKITKSVALDFKDGGAAIFDHYIGEIEDVLFVAYTEITPLSPNVAIPFSMAIYLPSTDITLVEKKILLLSNGEHSLIKADVKGSILTLSCTRFY